jgi:hypothetical protein
MDTETASDTLGAWQDDAGPRGGTGINLLTHGESVEAIRAGYLGLAIGDVDLESAGAFNVRTDKGA